MEHVYHFKPRGMFGETLYPLNQLKAGHPAVYEAQAAKYKGREKLLLKKIPLLDCLWNDVLHFSPINPQIIIDTMKSEGLHEHSGGEPGKALEVYRVPVRLLEVCSTVCFQSHNFEFGNFNPDLERFWRFDPDAYHEQATVYPEQIRTWHADRAVGRPLFWYSHTLHVLARQTIDIRECELITCG